MTLTRHQNPAPSPDGAIEAAAGRLSISIKRMPGGDCAVQAVEFAESGQFTRCVFSERNSPGEVLSPYLLNEIESFIEDSGTRVGVDARPDYLLNLPGLTLGKARILTTSAREGVHFYLVRFAQCIGNIASVVSRTARPGQTGYDQTQLIAAETLEKVFIPLMNFSDYVKYDAERLSEEGAQPMAESLNRTRQKISELELYYNMLVDFVASNRADPPRHTLRAISDIAGRDGKR